MEQKDTHFDKIFWFICGLCGFGAILTIFLIIYLPAQIAERIADTALIFWLSTAVSGGIGYLLGSSAPQTKNKPTTPGTTTAEVNITANTTTEDAEKK